MQIAATTVVMQRHGIICLVLVGLLLPAPMLAIELNTNIPGFHVRERDTIDITLTILLGGATPSFTGTEPGTLATTIVFLRR